MDLQKALEERLKQYGDMLLDDDEHERALKRVKRKNDYSMSRKIEKQPTVKTLPTLKRKSRTKAEPEKRNKHLLSIKETLENFESGLSEKHKMVAQNIMDNKLKAPGSNNGQPAPEVIVYCNPLKKRKMQVVAGHGDLPPAENSARFSMKEARHEVNKLGISGLVKIRREEAQAALAIKLGAKPLKTEYVNYKQLQEQKKREKEELQQTLTEARQHGLNLKNKKFKGKERVGKIKKELGFVDGQVGSYRDGVQFLSKTDIEKIKTSKPPGKFKKR